MPSATDRGRALNWSETLAVVKNGFDRWADQHREWSRGVDETPIPNDVCVCIAERLLKECEVYARDPNKKRAPEGAQSKSRGTSDQA